LEDECLLSTHKPDEANLNWLLLLSKRCKKGREPCYSQALPETQVSTIKLYY